MAHYLLFRIASWVVPRLPLNWAYFLAAVGGRLAFILARRSRAGAEANLRRVLGPTASPEQIRRTALGAFLTAARNYVDFFRIPRISWEELEKTVDVHGEHHFSQELKKGNGIIIVTAHLGNFDLLIQIMAGRAIPVTVLAEPLRPPQLFQLARAIRGSKGLTVLPTGTSSVKAALRTLRAGGVVALASDRDIQRNGIGIPFMGEEAQLPVGAIELAMRTKAALIPIFGLRGNGGHHQVFVEPPLDITGLAKDPEGVKKNLQKLAQIMEKYLRRYPEQWVVFQPIWSKTANNLGKKENLCHPEQK